MSHRGESLEVPTVCPRWRARLGADWTRGTGLFVYHPPSDLFSAEDDVGGTSVRHNSTEVDRAQRRYQQHPGGARYFGVKSAKVPLGADGHQTC